MKRKMMMYLGCMLLIVAFSSHVLADWDPGDDALFALLPDLSNDGLDVHIGGSIFTFGVWIADDFSVSSNRLMTDVHLWGSWLDDKYPMFGAGELEFYLAIYDDIPAYTDGISYSRPGNLLWQTDGGHEHGIKADSYRVYEDDLQEGYYAPRYPRNQSIYQPEGDTVCWQYNFYFDPEGAFELEADKVYWLQAAAVNIGQLPPSEEGSAYFGWKTSNQHYNDVAVLKDWNILPPEMPEWQMLKYPNGHPLAGGGIDLAFVITPEPATVLLLGLGGLLLRRKRKS